MKRLLFAFAGVALLGLLATSAIFRLGLEAVWKMTTLGVVESDFELAPASRLPRWFHEQGRAGVNYNVTLDYWGGPLGRHAVVTLWSPAGIKADYVVASMKGWFHGPYVLGLNSSNGLPAFEVLTARGITEIVEHRSPQPIFYLNDEPVVRAQLSQR